MQDVNQNIRKKLKGYVKKEFVRRPYTTKILKSWLRENVALPDKYPRTVSMKSI